MEKIMNFKHIKNKLYVSFSIVIISSCLLGIYNFIFVGKTNHQVEEMIEQDLPYVSVAEEINANLAQQTGLARGYLLYNAADYKQRYEAIKEENKTLEEQLAKNGNNEEIKELIHMKNQWEESVESVFSIYDAGNREQAMTKMTSEVEPLESEFRSRLEESLTVTKEEITDDGQSIIDDGKSTHIVIIVVTVLVAIISIAIELFIVRIISRPIFNLTKRMKLIAKGELHHEPLQTSLKDELGQLINATNEMNQNTNQLLGRIGSVSETVGNHSESLSQTANDVKAGSEQVATTMQELSAGSETQANNASDLALNMDNFTTKVRETNDKGALIQQASNEILTMTEEGDSMMKSSSAQMVKIDEIVKDAVHKVKDLDVQSQEISSLVNVIRDIADQTNLLALNAAIEAARAGEHGKGFAVVADEVRKLAEQVGESVTDITKIVSNIQQNSTLVTESLQGSYTEVEEGTSQIKSTQETFNGISMFVTEMVHTINSMADNLAEMTSNSNKMNESIQEIASITEESSAGIEQTSAAAQQSSSSMEEVVDSSQQLAKLAEDLNELVKKFKLR
ncbi:MULTISPECIES: methyl-accepting chemotaxis protein [Virgibacillus]|nr:MULTISPECIES: HAMP domain-containing methyl-accepting chemotaxis protein [Virgibacillus]WBX80547.1 HAMP domain-containing methyl-accepting chemotaxis protein [Virgibacillus salarius]